MARDQTLIVSASYDNSYRDWYDALPDPKVRRSTAEGGHPSQAFIRAFREDRVKHRAYLFLQDSLEPVSEDVAAPFAEAARKQRTPVIAWARFPLFFDTAEQEQRVRTQYLQTPTPEFGIFGPIFYAERKALEQLDKRWLFPKTPENKMDAQGTERAWAYAFASIGARVGFLHDWSNEFLESGQALPFRKVFAGRQ